MTMRLLAVLAVLLVLGPPADAQPQDLDVIVSPESADLDLGATLDITVAVTNTTTTPLTGSVVHLDITDPSRPGSVDPEDWTATLTKDLPAVAPGLTEVVPWTLRPIAGGRFSVYAVVMQPGERTIHVSGATIVGVAERRSLNPQGVLPVALGMPLLILFTLAGRRRSGRSRSAD